MRLAGKVAIISGAAFGMGAATARLFAREGAKVVIADVLEHEGRQVADAISASAPFEPLDVTKEESWPAVVAAATRHFGKLDVLVNNAGISGSAEQDFYSTEAWHWIMAVNATGVFFGIKYAIPAMVANSGGSIVDLSSIAGIIGGEHVPPWLRKIAAPADCAHTVRAITAAHAGNGLLRRVGLLTMVGGRSAFLPEMAFGSAFGLSSLAKFTLFAPCSKEHSRAPVTGSRCA